MAKRPKKPDPNPEQSLQTTAKNDSFGAPPEKNARDYRRVMARMNAFVREYEKQCGNISATCANTGVTRRSYYDWMRGTRPIYRRFQRKILQILPGEKLLDAAEHAIMKGISEGDLTAAIAVMNNLGHKRGWNRRPQEVAVLSANTEAAIAAVRSYQMWLKDNSGASEAEKSEWLSRFAKTGGIDESAFMKTMKVQELTASVQ